MKIFCFFALTFASSILFSQEKLHLISAHPFNGTSDDFESFLWEYSYDSLVEISQLATKDDYVNNVKIQINHKKVVIHKMSSIKTGHLGDNHRLLRIDYDSTLKINELDFEEEGLLRYYLTQRGENQSLTCYIFNKEYSNPRILKQIDLKNFQNIRNGELNSFKYSHLSGEYGGSLSCGDYIVAYSSEEDGFLSIPFHGDKMKRPKFPYELPEEYQFKSYSRHLVPINNDEVFVVAGNKVTKQSQIGSRQIIVFNKLENTWHDFTLKGNLAKTRGFRQWISGYIANESLGDDQILPGSEIWSERDSGLSPAVRYTLYAPGILYFYNALTKQYFEWETGQADSEVILIWEDKVIYRIYDELYLAEIKEGKNLTLSNTKLLVKDDVVPDIHWAFFSEE